jgi:acyl dehydratase
VTLERFPVEAGHILMFAHAIGDPNPVYVDADYARSRGFASVLAPPTFVEASAHFDPDHQCRPKLGEPWFGSAREPTGVPAREESMSGSRFHAETHLTFHRHVCAGEVLSADERPGKTWEKAGRRGGTMRFDDWSLEFRDASGAIVIVDRTVAVTTANKIDPNATPVVVEPRPSSPGVRGGSSDELGIGDMHEALVVDNLTRTQIIMYAGASGDFSPQHTDEFYNTRAAGYPTVFAHGMLSMAMTGRMLTDWLGDGRLTRFGMRFLAQVWPGDSLVARATVSAVDPTTGTVDLDVTTRNQHDVPVVSGYAAARLGPPRP